eukprot:gb/GECG01009705.1/.p1 GENE.gb/GECG01009705.1/~~gb/GECG01009705.1/.p1  ORF type:complete len:629 (+),score=40.57 gb/GECG01009705.1/:1-1887(+)
MVEMSRSHHILLFCMLLLTIVCATAYSIRWYWDFATPRGRGTSKYSTKGQGGTNVTSHSLDQRKVEVPASDACKGQRNVSVPGEPTVPRATPTPKSGLARPTTKLQPESESPVNTAVEFLERCPDTHQCSLTDYVDEQFILHPPRAIQAHEWVALVRVQKTASKTITLLLSSLLRSWGRKQCKKDTALAASFAPHPAEVQRAVNKSQEKDTFMRDPREVRPPNWSEVEIVSDPSFNSLVKTPPSDLRKKLPKISSFYRQYRFPSYNHSAVAPWYKGSLHPWFSFERPSAEGEGKLGSGYLSIAECESCKYWRRCHMHIRDVYGILVEMENRKPEGVRLLPLLRHPVPRVQSEFKYVAQLKKAWDYKTDERWKKLVTGVFSMRSSEREKIFREFMREPAHAYGMRNRQVKMLSGLVVEPEIASVKTMSKGLQAGELPSVFCVKGQKCSKESRTKRVSNAYTSWAEAALSEAKYQLLRNPAFIVSERLGESVAVFLYSIDWRPAVTWDGRHFPGTRMSQDSFLYKRNRAFSEDSKCSSRPISCEYNTPKECAFIKAAGRSLSWCRLVRVANDLVSKHTQRHGADKIRWATSASAKSEARALNLLDQKLYEFSHKLLSVRAAAVSKALSGK